MLDGEDETWNSWRLYWGREAVKVAIAIFVITLAKVVTGRMAGLCKVLQGQDKRMRKEGGGIFHFSQ